MALTTWMFACGFGWLWWRDLKKGSIYSYGSTYKRSSDPFDFWMRMSVLAVVILGLAGIAGAFTVDALWQMLFSPRN